MTRRIAAALGLGAWSLAAAAQTLAVHGSASRDSDGMEQSLARIGFGIAEGWGLRASRLDYRAPGWRRFGEGLELTWRRHAAGHRVDAAAGVARLAGRDRTLLELDAFRQLSPRSGVGASVERGFVDSVAGIDAGLMYTALALVGDHAFTPRTNVGVAAGELRFTDGNRRPYLRTRWNHELDPRLGWNAYLKTRHLRHREPDRPGYFSPERLGEVSLGMSLRVAVAEAAVLSAAADAGQQRTAGARDAVWSLSLGLGSRRGAAVEWRAAALVTDTAPSFASAGGNYRYRSLRLDLRLPI